MHPLRHLVIQGLCGLPLVLCDEHKRHFIQRRRVRLDEQTDDPDGSRVAFPLLRDEPQLNLPLLYLLAIGQLLHRQSMLTEERRRRRVRHLRVFVGVVEPRQLLLPVDPSLDAPRVVDELHRTTEQPSVFVQKIRTHLRDAFLRESDDALDQLRNSGLVDCLHQIREERILCVVHVVTTRQQHGNSFTEATRERSVHQLLRIERDGRNDRRVLGKTNVTPAIQRSARLELDLCIVRGKDEAFTQVPELRVSLVGREGRDERFRVHKHVLGEVTFQLVVPVHRSWIHELLLGIR